MSAQGGLAKEKVEKTEPVQEEQVEKEASETSTESEDESSNVDESASDESDDSGDDEEIKEEKPKKKKGGFQKRIDKLSQERNYWKEQALNKEAIKPGTPIKEESKVIEGRPNPENFDTHTDYVEALTDWKLEAREKERETKSKAEQAKADQNKKLEAFQSKVAEFEKVHSDYQDVVSDVEHVALSDDLQKAIIESKMGAHLAYELAKNEKELIRINKLSSFELAKEIGKLEYKLSSEASSSSKEIKTTKAPPPVKAIGTNSKTVTKDPEKMSFQEYKKWYAENKAI